MKRRRPERTLWYRIVQTNLETWLELACGPSGESPPAYVERAFRRYLECGILAHGFARAYCDECQHDFLSVKWEHDGGFSIDAAVCIEGTDRPGLERLLRYCARPPFALEHVQQRDAGHLVYRNPKPRPDGLGELVLTPLELIDKIAALVPPPRAHRHRYYGVLAPNASLRAAVTALASVAVIAPPAPTADAAATEEAPHRTVARYLWAALHAQQDGAGQNPARIAAECCWRASTKPCR